MHGPRSRRAPSRRRLPADVMVVLSVLSCALPLLLLWTVLVVDETASRLLPGALALATVAWIVGVAFAVRAGLLRRVRVLGNIVEAARVGDFSIRATHAGESGDVAELYGQLEALLGGIEHGRHAEQELLGMLQIAVDQIGVAIVVCDDTDRIRLVNPLAARLLRRTADELVGTEFAATPLADVPFATEPTVVNFSFPGAESRWQVSQQFYRHRGKPSRIVFVVDLRLALAEDEILIWQRLIRVISHEVNNSITPITSLCQTLASVVERGDAAQQTALMREGLSVIGERAQGLQEFISDYARVARLPEPQKTLFPVARLAQRVPAIFGGAAVVRNGEIPEATLFGDPVQLEQALINLLKNAVEANEGSTAPVSFACRIRDDHCEFEILDNGAGIRNPGNLFVPFYTTKPGGSGVGLVLCRRIAGKHHGRVTLENRGDASGAVARLTLPLSQG